jgi:uncharacterized protein YeaO (DUF488 family)
MPRGRSEIRIKRVYEPSAPSDGRRILVDRLWPRGVTKADADVDYWARHAAPSDNLRKWYRHDPAKWSDFRDRYFAELDANPEAVAELSAELSGGTVTFLFATRETELNNATALREYFESRS